MLIPLTIVAFLAACLLAAALSDLLTMTIPNPLTLTLACAFPVAAVLVGMDWTLIGWHLLAGVVVLVVSFVMFALGWIGGGDAKLAAATALWFGFSDVLLMWLLMTGLFGGALTLALLSVRRWPLPAFLARRDWILHLHAPETGIPYGVAIAAGALWVLPLSSWGKLIPL